MSSCIHIGSIMSMFDGLASLTALGKIHNGTIQSRPPHKPQLGHRLYAADSRMVMMRFCQYSLSKLFRNDPVSSSISGTLASVGVTIKVMAIGTPGLC